MAAAAQSLPARSRRGLHLIIPIAIFLAAVLGVLGYTMARGGTGAVRTNQMIGRPLPDFSMKTFDGGTVDPASLQGKAVAINFWGSWCGPCKDEAPVLNQAYAAYQARGVQFLGVATWDKEADARQFAGTYGWKWPNGIDNEGKIGIDFGVYGVPETYFVNRSGVLVDRFVGPFVGADGLQLLQKYLDRIAV